MTEENHIAAREDGLDAVARPWKLLLYFTIATLLLVFFLMVARG